MLSTLAQTIELPIQASTFWIFVLAQLAGFVAAFYRLQSQVSELINWKDDREKLQEDHNKERQVILEKMAVLYEKVYGLAEKVEANSQDIKLSLRELRAEVLKSNGRNS